MTKSIQGSKTIHNILTDLFNFSLSEKFKFSLKVSLALTLAYIIPFSQGWSQAQTAAITIMLIAVAGPVSESVSKGLRRVIGTILGAIIGMMLISIFPQNREIYLLLLSIFVTISLYLTRAYKGDTTVFMLIAVTMMMVFKNGEVDDVFIYGIDRTFMTIFGISIYTLIAVLIWPVKAKNNTMEVATKLLEIQSDIYKQKDVKINQDLYSKLREQEKLLEDSIVNSNYEDVNLNIEQRGSIVQNIKEINELLILLSYYNNENFSNGYMLYVNNFNTAQNEIEKMFLDLKQSMQTMQNIDIPNEWKAKYNTQAIKELSTLKQASLTATISDTQKLHNNLRILAKKFNAITSPYPTHFEITNLKTPSRFNWFDEEDLKGSLITFMIFWTTVIFWIMLNPPAGFLVVTLATSLSTLTTYSPLKPSLLIIVFTFSFIFATAMYILVLPYVYYGFELSIFIFIYSFIGFYFINQQISIFFLLGISILGLSNPMYYDFNLFLLTLFVFYLFLFALLVFYYIPFSTKPERLFLKAKNKFFKLSMKIMKREKKQNIEHLMQSVKKMQLWASKIDTEYFDTINKKELIIFTKECETFAYLLQILHKKDMQMLSNPLMKEYIKTRKNVSLANLLSYYTNDKCSNQIDEKFRDKKYILNSIEETLKKFLLEMKSGEYSQNEIKDFYENISLRRNVWISFLNSQKSMKKLDFNVLKRSRF